MYTCTCIVSSNVNNNVQENEVTPVLTRERYERSKSFSKSSFLDRLSDKITPNIDEVVH